jgi:hypothetical protein
MTPLACRNQLIPISLSGMTGPGWLADMFAVIMLLVAAICAARLALWRLRGPGTEVDADTVHLLMGVAMAGMFQPRLSPVPGTAWLPVFAVAGAWFTGQTIRARTHPPARLRCAHPAPHAVESAVMLFMLWPASQAGHGSPAMPGMNAGATAGANPVLALVLILFILGYILWTTDRITAKTRAGISLASHDVALAPRLAACYKIAMSVGMGYMLITML